jgi:hypothetical protein
MSSQEHHRLWHEHCGYSLAIPTKMTPVYGCLEVTVRSISRLDWQLIKIEFSPLAAIPVG